jgi:ABC-type multidrug transport system fused ATPase/permease subunit
VDEDRAYYRLQLLDKGTDNPDQRIADDLNIFVDLTLTLALGLLSAVVTLVSFVGILWSISGALTLFGVSIPGYMVWVALVYAIAGTWLDASDRQAADQDRLRPAALRGELPLLAGAAAREHRRGGALSRRGGRAGELPRRFAT